MPELDQGPAAVPPADGPWTGWPILWVLGLSLLIAGSLNPVTRPPGEYHLDKLAHLLAYGGLAVLPALLLRRGRAILCAALLLVVVGCGVEVLQSLVPGRQGSMGDAAANLLGVGLGVAAGWQLRPWLRRRRRAGGAERL